MSAHNKLTEKGFTLVELLLVVIIIGILSGIIISVLNPAGLRAKSRDAQRVSDIKRIQGALELYYADNRRYPPSPAWLRITGSDSLSQALSPSSGNRYISAMPIDPLQTGTNADPCNTPANRRYNYRTSSTGSYYLLTAIMEVATSDDPSKCSQLHNWSQNDCGASGTQVCGCTGGNTYVPPTDYCYGVENPL